MRRIDMAALMLLAAAGMQAQNTFINEQLANN